MPTCKQTKLFLPQLQTETQVHKTISLTKLDLTKYIKIITNHNLYSYFRCNPEIHPLCRLYGEENETAYHFLVDCPFLMTLLSNETNVLFEIRYTTDFYLYSKRKQSKARIAHVSLRNSKNRVENTTPPPSS